jgi:hypothetical protein
MCYLEVVRPGIPPCSGGSTFIPCDAAIVPDPERRWCRVLVDEEATDLVRPAFRCPPVPALFAFAFEWCSLARRATMGAAERFGGVIPLPEDNLLTSSKKDQPPDLRYFGRTRT